MEFRRIEAEKRNFLPLLLLGDEQEDMIDRYLDRGVLTALYDGGLRAVCVVTEEAPGVFEIKNLAVEPAFHRRGYGRAMVERAVRDCRAQSPDPALLPSLRVPGEPPGPRLLPSILRPSHLRRRSPSVGHDLFVHGAVSAKRRRR